MDAIVNAIQGNRKARKLVNALLTVEGSAIASIDTCTVEELKGGKKNPMQGRVKKHTERGRIMLFTNTNSNAYNNMVRRRLEKEGKNPDAFELSPRRWGQRVPETPFVEHNGNLYVEAIYMAYPAKVSYTLDGQPINKSEIVGIKEQTAEPVQADLNDKVTLRVYKLESIVALRMGENSVF